MTETTKTKKPSANDKIEQLENRTSKPKSGICKSRITNRLW